MRVSKQPGEKWLVQLRQGGGELDIKEKDDAVFDSEEGLIVYHNDYGKTVTFAPKEGIGWIRAYHPQGDGGFSKNRLSDSAREAALPRPYEDPRLLLEAREVSQDDAPEYPAPIPCPDCHHLHVMHTPVDGCRICSCILDDGEIMQLRNDSGA